MWLIGHPDLAITAKCEVGSRGHLFGIALQNLSTGPDRTAHTLILCTAVHIPLCRVI